MPRAFVTSSEYPPRRRSLPELIKRLEWCKADLAGARSAAYASKLRDEMRGIAAEIVKRQRQNATDVRHCRDVKGMF